MHEGVPELVSGPDEDLTIYNASQENSRAMMHHLKNINQEGSDTVIQSQLAARRDTSLTVCEGSASGSLHTVSSARVQELRSSAVQMSDQT